MHATHENNSRLDQDSNLDCVLILHWTLTSKAHVSNKVIKVPQHSNFVTPDGFPSGSELYISFFSHPIELKLSAAAISFAILPSQLIFASQIT